MDLIELLKTELKSLIPIYWNIKRETKKGDNMKQIEVIEEHNPDDELKEAFEVNSDDIDYEDVS